MAVASGKGIHDNNNPTSLSQGDTIGKKLWVLARRRINGLRLEFLALRGMCKYVSNGGNHQEPPRMSRETVFSLLSIKCGSNKG